ncbi:hypothetical protein [Anaerotruncus rubiinfantis]|uniref:hypothetical protein n=1 Tax=Anaerotruncus rubiinfantis TaxID=1720200 RepID=UPI000B323CAB|nr:hypothetical protein [Anaerotruncus rubiinfantis]
MCEVEYCNHENCMSCWGMKATKKLAYYEDIGTVEEFAALKKAHDDGRLVELPIIAMIEQTLENGKFKNSAKARAYNGRYAVVYIDKSKWSTPLIDICGSTPYRIDEAVDRMAALKEKETGTDVYQQDD